MDAEEFRRQIETLEREHSNRLAAIRRANVITSIMIVLSTALFLFNAITRSRGR